MARPSKLTPARQQQICGYIETGVPPEAAAAAAGIAPSTFYKWKQLGEQRKRGVYVEFLEAVKEAEAGSEAALVAQALAVGASDWKCFITILERRFPRRWARRTYKPDDQSTDTNINITFNRPAIDPQEKGDELVVAGSTQGKNGGNGNGK